jgi:hypothetical protein
VSLADDLIREYLAFKAGLKANTRRGDLSDMTDREQAGLWLKVTKDPLKMYDSAQKLAEKMRPFPGAVPRQRWPGARDLIIAAIKGETS